MPPRAIRRSPIRWRDSAASTCWPTCRARCSRRLRRVQPRTAARADGAEFLCGGGDDPRRAAADAAPGSGNVITVSSIAGLVAMNAAGPYCAAKFALEGWTESLAIEAAAGDPRDLVEPGAFRTEFAGDVNMRPTQRIEAYRPSIAPFETYRAVRRPTDGRSRQSGAAHAGVGHSHGPPVRLMLGRDAYAMWDTTSPNASRSLTPARTGKTPPLMAQNSLKFNCNAPR